MAFLLRKRFFVCFVCFVTVVVALLCSTPAEAQARKVYISVDMEGISGVVGDDQTSAGRPEYARSRKLMAEDANLLPEDLDPRARLISHSFKRHGMVEGLDDTFDAVIFIGYHAKADSPRGLFAHTGSGVVKDVQVNGRSAGEGGLNTLMAQWYGVPVVMISGDDVAIEQQKEWTPNVRGVVSHGSSTDPSHAPAAPSHDASGSLASGMSLVPLSGMPPSPMPPSATLPSAMPPSAAASGCGRCCSRRRRRCTALTATRRCALPWRSSRSTSIR